MTQDLEVRIHALEAKVGELNDREALRILRCRYHECINEGKIGEIPDLFTEDGTLDFGYLGKANGKSRIAEVFRCRAAVTAICETVHSQPRRPDQRR